MYIKLILNSFFELLAAVRALDFDGAGADRNAEFFFAVRATEDALALFAGLTVLPLLFVRFGTAAREFCLLCVS